MNYQPEVNKRGSIADRFSRTEKILSSSSFLQMEGISGEVPFFIFAYEPDQETAVVEETRHLLSRLRNQGIQITEINLYDLVIEIIKERGKWEKLLGSEAGMSKEKFKTQLQNLTDSETKLIPAICDRIGSIDGLQILFISGVGAVYPFVRTHNVLSNLQKIAKDFPTLLFFPGRYTHTDGRGSSLDLFGDLNEDKYYRAFNIEDHLL